MLPTLFLAAFALLLIWAACCDVATMEIPNRISVIAVALYPLAALISGATWQDILIHLGVGFGALVLFWSLFMIGLFGGGDAKLMAAAIVWTGPDISATGGFLLWTCIAGGLLALIAIVARKRFKPDPKLPSFVNRFLSEQHLPYAVAIAAGGIFVLAKLPIASV